MAQRNIRDLLREEYFSLLPHVRRVALELEAEVQHALVPIVRRLASYERVRIRSRIKECESAIAALQKRKNWRDNDGSRVPTQSLTTLNDLAGIRILAFPKRCALDVDAALRERFADWVEDPVPPIAGSANSIAFKYHGYCSSH